MSLIDFVGPHDDLIVITAVSRRRRVKIALCAFGAGAAIGTIGLALLALRFWLNAPTLFHFGT